MGSNFPDKELKIPNFFGQPEPKGELPADALIKRKRIRLAISHNLGQRTTNASIIKGEQELKEAVASLRELALKIANDK